VAARSTKIANAAKEALTAAGIRTLSLTAGANVVRAGTMHKMKGLEFQCVAVIGVDADVVPLPAAITSYEEDAKAHA
jgi:hypothetical protein